MDHDSVLIILGEIGRVIKKGSLVKPPPSGSNPLENFAFNKKKSAVFILSTSLNIGAKSAEEIFLLFLLHLSLNKLGLDGKPDF